MSQRSWVPRLFSSISVRIRRTDSPGSIPIPYRGARDVITFEGNTKRWDGKQQKSKKTLLQFYTLHGVLPSVTRLLERMVSFSCWWAMKLSFTRKRRLGALYKNKTLLKMCNFAQRLDHKHFLEFFALCLRQNHRFIIITMFSFQSKDERNVPSSCSLSLFFPINSNKVAASRLCRWLVYSLIIHTSQFVFQLYLYLNWTKMICLISTSFYVSLGILKL